MMNNPRQNGKSFAAMVAEICRSPSYIAAEEKCREHVRKLIKTTVPAGHENEYVIKVFDKDLVNIQIVAHREDGSNDEEVVVDGFPPESYYPLDEVDRESLPLSFIGDNVEISIVKGTSFDTKHT